jgi:voltage-gated potassium channel
MDSKLKKKLFNIIFEADTPAGKFFDIGLLLTIILSMVVVMLESVEEINRLFGEELIIVDWAITIIFTLEYIARIYVTQKPLSYVKSMYGVIDLISILPTYLSLIFAGTQYLIIIRALRLLRVFRVLKLVQFVDEVENLKKAVQSSMRKIMVFISFILIVCVISGSVMYLVEGPEHGFTSIPTGIYWSVVTITTVGYGDISPETGVGKTLSIILMVLGYGVIAVPTGLITANVMRNTLKNENLSKTCSSCFESRHDTDAKFCKYCGEKFED